MNPMRDNQPIDWHASTRNAQHDFGNRMSSAFLMNSWLSDVKFYVEQDDVFFPAHAFIVAIASPVLERCCLDGDRRTVLPNCTITVPNCSAQDFLVVLRYLYASGDGFNEITDRLYGLHEDNAVAILKVADFYDLRILMKVCVTFLTELMNNLNVCAMYDEVHLLSGNSLPDICVQYLEKYAKVVLQDGSLMQMGDSALSKLLESNINRVPIETYLFRAMFDWAGVQWTKDNPDGGSCSVANRRRILKDRLPLMRFDRMTAIEYTSCVKYAGGDFFTDVEIGAMIQVIVRTNAAEIPPTATGREQIEVREQIATMDRADELMPERTSQPCRNRDFEPQHINLLPDLLLLKMDKVADVVVRDGNVYHIGETELDKLLATNLDRKLIYMYFFRTLFDFAGEEWAANNKGVPCSSANRRRIMSDRMGLVRFVALSVNEYIACVAYVGWDFFTDKEIGEMIQQIMRVNAGGRPGVNMATCSGGDQESIEDTPEGNVCKRPNEHQDQSESILTRKVGRR